MECYSTVLGNFFAIFKNILKLIQIIGFAIKMQLLIKKILLIRIHITGQKRMQRKIIVIIKTELTKIIHPQVIVILQLMKQQQELFF